MDRIFGRQAAHGEYKVDKLLTCLTEDEYERMIAQRGGEIGEDVHKHRGEVYKGPGWAPVKSSVS